MNDYTAVDHRVLDNLISAIGAEAAADFALRFVQDCRDRVHRIQQAYEAGHVDEVIHETHTLGSSAATYGLRSLEVLCRKIENADPPSWTEQEISLLVNEAREGRAQLLACLDLEAPG
ncbi:Hpt domain-containing protein [Kiloniella sp. b19]|uniref:Hpt domain-containing protein n=1 Tax=Kiloniella sp. GXU_MW_B19 TaxID=3141326 RepID=UPI0031DFAC16